MDIEVKNIDDYLMPVPDNSGFKMDDYWVWCGSVVKGEDGCYHMFASRWRKTLPFHPGWAMESEVVRAKSATPEGPYTFEEVVLPARGAQYWDGRATHNPAIIKHNDEYILFYTGTTYPYSRIEDNDPSFNHTSYQFTSARANKRIGIAISKSIYGPWERRDTPILQTRPDHFDNLLTSNPAPCINEDGSCLLVYKTRTYNEMPYTYENLQGPMLLGVAYAPHYTQEFKPLTDKPLFDLKECIVEDPFIWNNGEGYSMIAKDWRGDITGTVGNGMFASSKDGVDWKVEQNFCSLSRYITKADGSKQLMGNMDRPFLLKENGQFTHLFIATNNGSEAKFTTQTESWNMCIPLK